MTCRTKGAQARIMVITMGKGAMAAPRSWLPPATWVYRSRPVCVPLAVTLSQWGEPAGGLRFATCGAVHRWCLHDVPLFTGSDGVYCDVHLFIAVPSMGAELSSSSCVLHCIGSWCLDGAFYIA